MNGDVSESADLESGTPNAKVYHVEGIRSILASIPSIYLLKNIFVERFGEKFAENDHFPL